MWGFGILLLGGRRTCFGLYVFPLCCKFVRVGCLFVEWGFMSFLMYGLLAVMQFGWSCVSEALFVLALWPLFILALWPLFVLALWPFEFVCWLGFGFCSSSVVELL